MPNRRRSMPNIPIMRLPLPRIDLQTRLDHVRRRRKIRSGDTRQRPCGQELRDRQRIRRRFPEIVLFEVGVGRKVDCAKGDVAEETGRGTLVESHCAEAADNVEGSLTFCGVDAGFGEFALDLEADFHDFEGVGEDLPSDVVLGRGHTTWQAPAEPPATSSQG